MFSIIRVCVSLAHSSSALTRIIETIQGYFVRDRVWSRLRQILTIAGHGPLARTSSGLEAGFPVVQTTRLVRLLYADFFSTINRQPLFAAHQ